MNKLQSISATELSRRSGEIIKRVVINDEHLLVERDGFPLVVIIPVHEYNATHSVGAAKESEPKR